MAASFFLSRLKRAIPASSSRLTCVRILIELGITGRKEERATEVDPHFLSALPEPAKNVAHIDCEIANQIFHASEIIGDPALAHWWKNPATIAVEICRPSDWLSPKLIAMATRSRSK